jgi:hypothetical protein
MTVLFPADISKKSQLTLATYFYFFYVFMITDNALRRPDCIVLNITIITKHRFAQREIVAEFQGLSQQQPFFYAVS